MIRLYTEHFLVMDINKRVTMGEICCASLPIVMDGELICTFGQRFCVFNI